MLTDSFSRINLNAVLIKTIRCMTDRVMKIKEIMTDMCGCMSHQLAQLTVATYVGGREGSAMYMNIRVR